MSWSANEVQALATKAARGGGAPAGQAATFGRASVCHLIGGGAPDDLTDALNALPDGPILDLPLALAVLLEQAANDKVKGHIPCQTPLLAQSYVKTMPFAHQTKMTGAGVDVVFQLDTPAPRGALKRLDVPQDLVTLMTTLAARTFVPESDASRLAGAGAGLTDND